MLLNMWYLHTPFAMNKGKTITIRPVASPTPVTQFIDQINDDAPETSLHCQNERGSSTTAHTPALVKDADRDNASEGDLIHLTIRVVEDGDVEDDTPPIKNATALSAHTTFAQTAKGDFATLANFLQEHLNLKLFTLSQTLDPLARLPKAEAAIHFE